MNPSSKQLAAGFIKQAAANFAEAKAREILKQADPADEGYLDSAIRYAGYGSALGSIGGAITGGIGGVEGGPAGMALGAGLGALTGGTGLAVAGIPIGLGVHAVHSLFGHKKPVLDPRLNPAFKQASDDSQSSFLGRYMNLKAHRIQNLFEHPVASGAVRGAMLGLPIPKIYGAGNSVPFAATSGLTSHMRDNELQRQEQELSQTGYGANAVKGMQSGAVAGAIGGPVAKVVRNAIRGRLPSIPGMLGSAAIGTVLGGGAGGDLGLLSKFVNKHTSSASKEEARMRLSKHPILHGLPGADIISALRPWKKPPTDQVLTHPN